MGPPAGSLSSLSGLQASWAAIDGVWHFPDCLPRGRLLVQICAILGGSMRRRDFIALAGLAATGPFAAPTASVADVNQALAAG